MNFIEGLILSTILSILFYYYYYESNFVIDLDYPYIFMIMHGFMSTRYDSLNWYYYAYCFVQRYSKMILVSVFIYGNLINNPSSFWSTFKTFLYFHLFAFLARRYLKEIFEMRWVMHVANMVNVATNSYVVRNVYVI